MLGLAFLLNSSGKNTWFHAYLAVVRAGEPIDELIGPSWWLKVKKEPEDSINGQQLTNIST